MRYASFVLIALATLFAPALFAQFGSDDGGLTVEVEPVVEGKATPGDEFTFKLSFTVPDGFHAYHKDNPGFSLPVKVEFSELSGLTLKEEVWPEPHKKVDEFGEEWELDGTFHIEYIFNVPQDASGSLKIAGSHETQFCDAGGCFMSESEFEATIEVAEAADEPEVAADLPAVKTSASFEGPATASGEAKLKLHFDYTDGYHAYHKDNPGYGLAPKVEFKELSGLTVTSTEWPDYKTHEYDVDWVEWEYPDELTLTYTLSVPRDASGDLPVKIDWSLQVCNDDGCWQREGVAETTLTVSADDGGEEENAEPEPPKVTATAEFEGEVTAGDPAILKVRFDYTDGYHTFHEDTPGYGSGPDLKFVFLDGLERADAIWPKYVEHEYEEDWIEWEYPDEVTLTYELPVPEDVFGERKIKIKWDLELGLGEETWDFEGELEPTISVKPLLSDEKDEHGFYKDFNYAMQVAKQEEKQLLIDFNGRY